MSNPLKEDRIGEEFIENLVESNKNNTESPNSTTIADIAPPTTWLGGIIIDTFEIDDSVWDFLFQLNCQYQFGIHTLVRQTSLDGVQMILKSREKYDNCATFILHQEVFEEMWKNAKNGTTPKNRIDRISILRDFQRDRLMEIMQKDNVIDDGIVILTDLDLKRLPSIQNLIKQIDEMKSNNTISSYPHDAICSLGKQLERVSKKNVAYRPALYYDIYATVFLPDTFTYPLRGRLFNESFPGEDVNYIATHLDAPGSNFTQHHMLKYIEREAAAAAAAAAANSSNQSSTFRQTGNFRVRSCFGGLGIYKAKVYFQPQCRYQLTISDEEIENPKFTRKNISSSIMRYAIKGERRPCEHVVLHDCLLKLNSDFNIAINTNLETVWKKVGFRRRRRKKHKKKTKTDTTKDTTSKTDANDISATSVP